MTNPDVFAKEDLWASRPKRRRSRSAVPYYVIMKLPGGAREFISCSR
jgi:hypothetical protein